MNRTTPGLPVHHELPESTQTHVHRVSDAIQPSHPLSSPSPPARKPSQHQSHNSRTQKSEAYNEAVEGISATEIVEKGDVVSNLYLGSF